jgi:hypothetical protein
MMVEIFPVTTLGFNKPQTTSTDLGIGMFSFDIENLLVLTAMAAPPPLCAPGRGVLIYFMPPISSNSSSLN